MPKNGKVGGIFSTQWPREFQHVALGHITKKEI